MVGNDTEELLISRALELREIGSDVDAALVNVSVDLVAGSVQVWRVKDNPLPKEIRRRYDSVVSGVRIEYRSAEISNQQKAELDRLVHAQSASLKHAGVEPTSFGCLDGWDHPYVVTYNGAQPPEELVERFQIFGQGSVDFRQGDALAL